MSIKPLKLFLKVVFALIKPLFTVLERYKVAHAKQLEGNAEPAAGPSSGAKINIAPQETGEQPKKGCC